MKKQQPNAIVLFVLPIDTKRKLGEDGWIFETKRFVPNSVADKVVIYFNVHLKEEFLGINKYQSEMSQINLILDETNKISEIFIRTKLEKEKLLRELKNILSEENVEIFDPSQSK